ncbi:unnamed protein product [marine sediment metagenome]|uniref:Uncharacterized protein n=1 Tax=marine sediment metagenome TaxID=412755 RepID=X1A780_9ZZZZ
MTKPEMDRTSIWNCSQNKPTMIVDDLSEYIPSQLVYESLLRRGVFKWFAVRRHLIRLKNTWKMQITDSIHEQRQTQSNKRKHWLRGYRFGLEQARREVRGLCHSDRWQAPDHDRLAQHWLEIQ